MWKNLWILFTFFLLACTTATGAVTTATPEPESEATPAPSLTTTPEPTPVATPATEATSEVTPVPSPSADESAESQINIPAQVPAVDLSQHSVPLEEVYFDTFRPVNRALPLSAATPELIERLRDAIPPIHAPQYESASSADWLRDLDRVLGYSVGDRAWAFPIRILNFHEIVNDSLAGQPVLISYCPLCASGIVFSRQLGERVLTFGNTSALYESDMVMLDYNTGSYWWQVAGEAIVGSLTGERLTVLPSVVATWRQWRELHPSTWVLARPTSRPAGTYERDPFLGFEDVLNSGRFPFPVSPAGRDGRLRAADRILAVKVGQVARGYPLSPVEPTAILDTIGDRSLVVFTVPDGPTGAVFEPLASGRALTFEVRDGRFFDRETGSAWNLAGQAVSGPLSGEQLAALPSRTTFWYAIVAAEPEITLYHGSGDG